MSALVAWLDRQSAGWAALMVERGLVGLIVLLVVAAVVLVLRRWASAHLLSWLWLLPLLALVLPAERLMPALWPGEGPRGAVEWVVTPLERALAGNGTATRSPPRLPAAASAGDISSSEEVVSSGAADLSPERPSPWPRPALVTWAMGGWALMALLLAGRQLRSQGRARHLLGPCTPVEDTGVLATLDALRREAGVRAEVRLALCEALASPATWGWRRPLILLPPRLLLRLSPAQLRWVLLHELAHIRRHDLLIAGLQRLVAWLWWFHPAVWIASAAVERERECACDDAASARSARDTRRSCAQAFFEVVAAVERPQPPAPALASLLNNKTFIKERLMRILDSRRPVAAGISPASVAGLVLCGLLSFTLARAQEPGSRAVARVVQEAQGQSPEVRAAITRGVRWLCHHQQEDGRWRVSPDPGVRFKGLESETSSTALAVLALLDAGQLVDHEGARPAIARGLAWLEKKQGIDGSIGPREGSAWTYGHALATLAFCAQQRRAPSAERQERIGRAAAFIQKLQNPYCGWRYGMRDGDNDSKMTSLMMLALLEAREAGVDVPEKPLQWGLDWLDQMTDKECGRVGWIVPGGPPGRLLETAASHPAKLSEETTALCAVMQLALGREPEKDALLERAVHLVLQSPPEWGPEGSAVDYSYWFWGAALFARLENPGKELWKEAALKALLSHARPEDGADSVWPLADAWSLPGLEVYATAMCVRTLCASLLP